MSDQDGPADPPHEEPPTEPEDAPSKPKEPPTVDEWIEKQRQGYTRHSSFHTIYVREDMKQILLCVTEEGMGRLFFTQLTSQGAEGGLPMNRDETPKNVGLQFVFAPNKKEVMLVEAQAPITGAQLHLAASMYEDVQCSKV